MESFLRRLAILEYLRQAKEHVSTDQIVSFLTNEGYLDEQAKARTRYRSVQRDLNFLLGREEDGEPDNNFGLDEVPGDGRSRLWRVDPYNGLSYDFEKMPQNMAIAFAMTQKHLSDLLPRNTHQELQRLFLAAEHKLAHSTKVLTSKNYGRLKDAIEFYQRGQTLKAADYELDHLDTIYRAIAQQKQVSFEYRDKLYRVHPLGVAILLPKLYLVGMKAGEVTSVDETRNFLIHKIKTIWIENRTAEVPDGFELKRYLEQGNMDVFIEPRDKQTYRLKLEIKQGQFRLIEDLTESPVSEDQMVIEQANGTYLLEASVRRTVQLRSWLVSMGQACQVIAPEVIREDVISHMTLALNLYTKS